MIYPLFNQNIKFFKWERKSELYTCLLVLYMVLYEGLHEQNCKETI
jgi:hypothetical protein